MLRITRDEIVKDVERFSRLHSWYKHLPANGRVYIPIFLTGHQPRDSVHPEITDRVGLHVHFRAKIFMNAEDLLTYAKGMPYPVTFNMFFRGLEPGSSVPHIISYDQDEWKEISDYVSMHHPDCVVSPIYTNETEYEEYIGKFAVVFEREHDRQITRTVEIVVKMARDLGVLIE